MGKFNVEVRRFGSTTWELNNPGVEELFVLRNGDVEGMVVWAHATKGQMEMPDGTVRSGHVVIIGRGDIPAGGSFSPLTFYDEIRAPELRGLDVLIGGRK